ncbi:ABC transporter permease [Paenibacillus sp. HN-1]|uniref:ABC transporter permease n=1 Tax=Paenibacillus TaxID=44249 RepID=UPI001CA93EFE|nr:MULTISPECIES: ABC transporter permease [Paenibacillus]MBY9078492.1 ABC transporter permease [Paenibacillus sp. CGMCC 1.18879]MBY9082785.1 ABC transporter permease [Paenibacillus sinensis]
MDRQVMKRFMKRKVSIVGGVIIMIFIVTALIGPFLAPYDPLEQDLANNYQGPSVDHLLGTDNLGRDTLSRLIYGARISLMISVISVGLSLAVGLLLGVTAGYYGGRTESVIMRFVDILLAFPGILLAIVIVAVLGNGLINTMIAVAVFSVPDFSRIIRSSVISLKKMDYIEACRASGASDLRIIMKHIIPNSLSPIIVQSTLMLGTAILTASGLSFIGLGVQPPDPEWGAMLSKSRELMRSAPMAAIAPGVAITLVVLSFSLVGDGLRDALDPKLKN